MGTEKENYNSTPYIILQVEDMKLAIVNVHLQHSDNFHKYKKGYGTGKENLDSIRQQIAQLRKELKIDALIIAGDFNNNKVGMPSGYPYVDVCVQHGATQPTVDPTKIALTTCKLDHILMSANINCISCKSPYFNDCSFSKTEFAKKKAQEVANNIKKEFHEWCPIDNS